MISVLIPVFNRNIRALVAALEKQMATANFAVETVVMDDASSDEKLKAANRALLQSHPLIKYIELPENVGRNMIRHRLAAEARYDSLVFLDADSSFPDNQWLQRYAAVHAKGGVVMGGRLYHEAMGSRQPLHRVYGAAREQRTANERSRAPYQSFLACNFMISKADLSRLIIDPKLTGYCHEDTFMGLQFEQLNVPVLHIDNPVYHEGIDSDESFMAKQKEALINLRYLYNTYHSHYRFTAGVKLIRVYLKLSGFAGGRYFLQQLLNRQENVQRKAIHTQRLYWLDAWKLAVFHSLMTLNK